MELLFAVFFLLFLYKIEFGVSDEFMSKDYTTYLRGICAEEFAPWQLCCAISE